MKKIFLLLTVIGLSLTSCSDDDVDRDTFSEVFEVDNVNFLQSGNFSVTVPLNPQIYASDVILVYRLAGANSQGNDIWEPIPTTYNLAEGQLNYFFDFSRNDVVVYLDSDFDPMLRQDFSLGQVLRIVIVPGYFSQSVDINNYDAVISALNTKQGGEVQIQKL